MRTTCWAAGAAIAATMILAGAARAAEGDTAGPGDVVMKPFAMPTLEAPGEWVDMRKVFTGPKGQALPAIETKDGHFVAGGQRVRFWGVNLCFGACFPPHDVADKLAARLAAFGVNCVRLHHMDYHAFPSGIWKKDFSGLDEEALDRLDYLLAALGREGVYVNVNLHVSRNFVKTGAKDLESVELPEFGKRVDIFDAELIALQRDYARALLGHRNKYTGRRLAEDPVVGLVEITNEDSLFMPWVGWGNDNYAPRFEKELGARWNAWLRARYGSNAALREAWSGGEEPLGAEMLSAGNLPADAVGDGKVWRLSANQGARATAKASTTEGDGGALDITIEKITPTFWHVELRQSQLKVEKGRTYTVRLRARADHPRRIGISVQQEMDPWKIVGLSREVMLSPEWKAYELSFRATADEANAKLGFFVGQETGNVLLSDVSMRPGGRLGLKEGESAERGTVERMQPSDQATTARGRDYLLFLADTEREYFDGMRTFLRKEVGVRAPVTGTIGMGLVGTWVQAGLDYVDGHAYWEHPHFPNRPWDGRDWVIGNTPMVDSPQRSTLVNLAAARMLQGSIDGAVRPFTVTEYNHPAPNDWQAEGIPMVASFAASQDWDGVFLFAYSHTGDWRNEKAAGSFFDIDANPVKMAQMAAGAMLFRRGDIAAAPVSVVTAVPPTRMAELMAEHHGWGADILSQLGAPAAVRFFGQYGVAPYEMAGEGTTHLVQKGEEYALPKPDAEKKAAVWRTAGGALEWAAYGRHNSAYLAQGERSAAVVGFIGGKPWKCGPVETELDDPPGQVARFAAVTASSLDGERLERSRRLLVTVCARTGNTGMEWNETRTSVSDRWGKAPTTIEPVTGAVTVQHTAAGKARVTAMDGRGQPAMEWPAEIKDGKIRIPLRSDPATVWYVVEVE